MKPLKLKLTLACVLLSAAHQVSAHAGNHDVSSWHHYLTSADHAAVFLLLVLSGLGVLTYFSRKRAGTRTLAVRK